ncbi:MAG TPA: peptidoglycan bridge formation glycyltransferase FemA/FemB family protein [Candidatus Polarisedimenticolaceae bacterium]|nr:peptidoglycan bridge formation glycyltransferase FemA/FemB family protein [Candidatus Polarisedimenticolaceae bacterium]
MKHGLPPDDWDLQLQKLGGTILQSRLWMLFQQHLDRDVVCDEGDGWQWAASVRGNHGLRYVHCAYGPVARDEAVMSNAVMSAVRAAKDLGTDFVRIEPQAHTSAATLRKLGARQLAEFDPQHTQVIDLTKTEEKLRDDLASGHRNLINGTRRRGIAIRQSDKPGDFEEFLTMLADTARRSGVSFFLPDYFRALWEVLQPAGAVTLYVAEAEGLPVASALFYDWGDTRYYAHAGAYQEHNRRVKASVSLVWQAITDAKAAGLKRFDLWGVAPANSTTHHLAALSRFKRAFGGYQVDYLGTWDIPVKPAKYAAYSVYRKLRGNA